METMLFLTGKDIGADTTLRLGTAQREARFELWGCPQSHHR